MIMTRDTHKYWMDPSSEARAPLSIDLTLLARRSLFHMAYKYEVNSCNPYRVFKLGSAESTSYPKEVMLLSKSNLEYSIKKRKDELA
jgi:hypothetical protein